MKREVIVLFFGFVLLWGAAQPSTPKSTRTIRPKPTSAPAPANTLTPAPPACFDEPHVYLAGQMNIRQSHSVNSALAGHTNVGDIFDVSETFQGATYCWLRIDHGWIARLGVVQSVVKRVNSIRLPDIQGHEVFVSDIRRALDYMKKSGPKWFVYIVSNTRSIGPSPYGNRSIAKVSRKHTQIAPMHHSSIIKLASVLVHEACHMVQYDRDGAVSPTDYDQRIQNERECLRIQIDMMQDYAPTDPFLFTLRTMLRRSDSDWMTHLR